MTNFFIFIKQMCFKKIAFLIKIFKILFVKNKFKFLFFIFELLLFTFEFVLLVDFKKCLFFRVNGLLKFLVNVCICCFLNVDRTGEFPKTINLFKLEFILILQIFQHEE